MQTKINFVKNPNMPIIAKRGEWVTCPAGHRVAQLTADVELGCVLYQDLFSNWQTKRPRYGEEVQPCILCGQNFFRQNSSRQGKGPFYQIYIENRGWIPPRE